MARYTDKEKKKRQRASKASKKSLKISSTEFQKQFELKKDKIKKTMPGKEGLNLIEKLKQDYKSMGYL